MVRLFKPVALCIPLALAISCTGLLETVRPSSDRNVTFSATREHITRTALKGNSVNWLYGDRIAVFSGSAKAEFVASEISGATCSFTGIISDGGDGVYALYPFSSEASCSSSVISATLPSVQKAVKGGFDPASALSVASSAEVGADMTFRNVGSVIRFSISRETAADLVEVTLKSTSGAALSGKAEVSFSDGVPVIGITDGSDEVTLQGHFEEGEYCFVVFPGAHDGLTLSFRKARSTGVMTSAFKGTFDRSTSSDMGLLSPASWVESDNYQPVDLNITFYDGAGFVNPFASPDLTALSTMTTSPSYMGTRTEFKLSESDGGYTFAAFGSKGILRTSSGIAIGSSSGDYFEFPGIPGLCLNRVVITAASGMSGGVSIASDEGTEVLGGSVIRPAAAGGDVLDWTLYGSERGRAYRLQSASAAFMYIRSIYLEYGLDPIAPVSGNVSPFDYGLREATTGEERFQALYRAHVAALGLGVEVDYSDVGTVELVIPSGARSIPLTRNTDFKNTVFKVRNDAAKFFLFSMENVFSRISVNGTQIDAADYSSSSVLSRGLHILKIMDDKHWVDDREGFDHPHDRGDAVLVRDGVGSCTPVASYSTAATLINAEWCPADDSLKSFSNVTLIRDVASTQNCCLVAFRGQNNVLISNVTIQTPSYTGINGDTVIDVRYCTNVLCEDMVFNGLYCEEHASGYGLSFNVTWNTTFRRITSHNLWAAFGCNNMQDSFLEDSDVERFDIHCYGKNITIRNTTLTGKGLPCSSVYGTILCENVKFVDCYLYSMRADYNSYVPFDLVIRDCEYYPTTQNGLINIGRLDMNINARPELARKCWPNLDIDGLDVHFPVAPSLFSFYLFPDSKRYDQPIGYISSVKVRDMEYIYSANSTFRTYVVTTPVDVENNFLLELDNVRFLPQGVSGNARVTMNIKGNASSKVTNSKAYVD